MQILSAEFMHGKFTSINCYILLKRFSGLLVSKPDKPNGSWELVEQPNDHDSKCDCKRLKKTKVGKV